MSLIRCDTQNTYVTQIFPLSPIVSVLAYYHKAPMDGKSLSALLPMVIEWGSGLGTLWSLRGKK